MNTHQECRRRLIKRGAIALMAIPVIALNRSALAGKASKPDFHYQDHPKDGMKCADCAQFLPSQQGTEGDGTCRLVDGPISRDGWCMAFTKK